VSSKDSTFPWSCIGGNLAGARVPTAVLHRPNPGALETPGFIGFFARRDGVAEREGFSPPFCSPLTNQKTLTYTLKTEKYRRTTDASPLNYVVATATVRYGSAQYLYSRCTEFSAGRLNRLPKIAEVPTLPRFVGLERAKGIEPSYAAWEVAS
jgi:hypothetical protein